MFSGIMFGGAPFSGTAVVEDIELVLCPSQRVLSPYRTLTPIRTLSVNRSLTPTICDVR